MTGKIKLQFRGEIPERLDKFLASSLSDYSRSQIQRWIKEGRVEVAGHPVLKAGALLDEPLQVTLVVPPPVPSELEPESIPLAVIFENDELLLVDKPAGMVVHPSPGHDRGTLVHAILAHAPEIEGVGGVRRPGVVHRLDKDTSGLIVVAKNQRAHRQLQEQFRRRQVEKTYFALVDGMPPTPSGRVEAAISRDPAHRQRMAVVPEGRGRAAVTEYFTLEALPEHTFLEARPITGRTHQIRVHLAFLGCPVVGDRVYGRKRPSLNLGRHFLHAGRLKITLPGERVPRLFQAPLPPDLQAAIDRLAGRASSIELSP